MIGKERNIKWLGVKGDEDGPFHNGEMWVSQFMQCDSAGGAYPGRHICIMVGGDVWRFGPYSHESIGEFLKRMLEES